MLHDIVYTIKIALLYLSLLSQTTHQFPLYLPVLALIQFPLTSPAAAHIFPVSPLSHSGSTRSPPSLLALTASQRNCGHQAQFSLLHLLVLSLRLEAGHKI